MEKIKYTKQNGFTLIEIVVALSIFTILAFGVYQLLNDIFVNSNQQTLSMDNIDQARLVLSTFTNEIRDATTGSDGSFPLNQVDDSQIIFYSNFGTNNSVVKRIRYYISGSTLYKGIILPTGSPLAYNLFSESVSPVLTGVSNGSSQLFYYYDGNYDGSTSALSQPVNINRVRFVRINLMVLNQITPTDKSTFSISTGAAIRSIKDNLGN